MLTGSFCAFFLVCHFSQQGDCDLLILVIQALKGLDHFALLATKFAGSLLGSSLWLPFALEKKLIHFDIQCRCPFPKCLQVWNSVPVFHAREVATQQSCPFLDIALRITFCGSETMECGSDVHRNLISETRNVFKNKNKQVGSICRLIQRKILKSTVRAKLWSIPASYSFANFRGIAEYPRNTVSSSHAGAVAQSNLHVIRW